MSDDQQQGLPSGFFAVPPEQAFIGLHDEKNPEKGKDTLTSLQFLYSEVIARLREENSGAGTLELMMMERIAFLFMYMKFMEARKTFKYDTDYRAVLQLWSGLVNDLSKMLVKSPEEVKDAVLSAVSGAIASAMNDLPADQRELIGERLASSFEKAGLSE